MEMMGQNIKRESFADWVIFAVEWIKKNQTMFLSIASIALGIIALSAFTLYRLHTLQNSAADRLSMAQGMLYQGQRDQALGMLDEIITRYSSTDFSVQAALIKSDYLMSQKNYNEVENTMKPIVLRTSPKELLPFAYIILATAQEDNTKYDDAIKTYNEYLSKYSAHFSAPKVYEALGRLYEIKNDYANAAQQYEKIVALYPNSPWSQRAQERASIMAGAKEKMAQQQPMPAK